VPVPSGGGSQSRLRLGLRLAAAFAEDTTRSFGCGPGWTRTIDQPIMSRPLLTVSGSVRECQAYSTRTSDESFLCHGVSASVTALLSKLLSKRCAEICLSRGECRRKNLTRIYLVCHSVSGSVLACQSVSGSVTHNIAPSFRSIANVQTWGYGAMHGAGFA